MHTPRPSFFKKWQWTIYFSTMFFLGILMAEIALRLLFPQFSDTAVFADLAFEKLLNSRIEIDSTKNNYDPKLGFRFSANTQKTFTTPEFTYTATTNTEGFRSKAITPKQADEYRVLLLGDSFFWGVGVKKEQMVCAFLEHINDTIPLKNGNNLSVYNYGISGYNTVQELQVARLYTDTLSPDHLVLGLFIGNDIIANRLTYVNTKGDFATDAQMVEKTQILLKKRTFLAFPSVLYRAFIYFAYLPRLRYQIAEMPDFLAATFTHLQAFQAFCKTHKMAFSVVLIYPKDGVAGGIQQWWSNSRNTGQALQTFLKKEDIPYLDMLDLMKGKEAINTYFHQTDGHFNDAGNRLMAKGIWERFLEKSVD